VRESPPQFVLAGNPLAGDQLQNLPLAEPFVGAHKSDRLNIHCTEYSCISIRVSSKIFLFVRPEVSDLSAKGKRKPSVILLHQNV
jgi:hypothetical protein